MISQCLKNAETVQVSLQEIETLLHKHWEIYFDVLVCVYTLFMHIYFLRYSITLETGNLPTDSTNIYQPQVKRFNNVCGLELQLSNSKIILLVSKKCRLFGYTGGMKSHSISLLVAFSFWRKKKMDEAILKVKIFLVYSKKI